MSLGYSVVFFLAGLLSHVFSPIALNPGWNDSSKVSISIFGLSPSLMRVDCRYFLDRHPHGRFQFRLGISVDPPHCG